ncbi:hypothetical protein M8J76_005422 [Diaphorina citri]|nr:hypothetical protein M8J76_005422 [Diaphorina citri]
MDELPRYRYWKSADLSENQIGGDRMNPQADLPVNQFPVSIPYCAVRHQINPSMYILDIEKIRTGPHESNVHSGETLTDNHLLTVPLIGGPRVAHFHHCDGVLAAVGDEWERICVGVSGLNRNRG